MVVRVPILLILAALDLVHFNPMVKALLSGTKILPADSAFGRRATLSHMRFAAVLALPIVCRPSYVGWSLLQDD
jgi:hypothetical protein